MTAGPPAAEIRRTSHTPMTSTHSRLEPGGETGIGPVDRSCDDSDVEIMPEDDIDPRHDFARKHAEPARTPPPAKIHAGETEKPRNDLIMRMMREALAEMAAESPIVVANWIAQVVDPQRPSTIVMICDPATSVSVLSRAKDLYKLMRILGQSQDLRRMGRRMYAAAIAAAIVHHGVRISGQSERALARAFHFLALDDDVPRPIREVVRLASSKLPQVTRVEEEGADLSTILASALKAPPAPPKRSKPVAVVVPDRGALRRRRAKRDAHRIAGVYDPVYGASFQQRQAYCQACRGVVEVRRKLPLRALHGWVSMLTLGLWLPIWGMLELVARFSSWRCVNCRRRIYEALIS